MLRVTGWGRLGDHDIRLSCLVFTWLPSGEFSGGKMMSIGNTVTDQAAADLHSSAGQI